MIPAECLPGRRNFLKAGVVLATGLSGVALLPQPAVSEESDAWVIGPKPGFTPEIGTLTSMLAFTRMQVLNSVKGMSQADRAQSHQGQQPRLLPERAERIA